MFQCKKCGRKFKSMQALGGHVGRKHPQQENTIATPSVAEEQVGGKPVLGEPSQTPVSPSSPTAQEAASASDQPSEAEQIREFLKQGYTFSQLTESLGFKPSTVRQEIAKMLSPGKKPQKEEGDKDESLLPVVLKNGKGEAISPEAVYYQLVEKDGIDGKRDFQALMKWAACIELAQRMSQIRKSESEAIAKMFEPMLDMMEKSRQELDAAAQRNRESMTEVASAAAGEAAARAMMHIDQRFDQAQERKRDIAEVQDPMKGLMARTMETILNQISGQMFGGGQQQSLPPAWKDERQGGK